MKICGIVCEYNPFHNGHAYLLSRAKELSGCDAVVCLMSGSFVQRGEPAILDRFTRAEHAVLAGADAVLELPAAFALSPAELFAAGAIGILSAIPEFCAIAFGCESGTEEEYRAAAKALCEESAAFKRALKENLKKGISHARARIAALNAAGEEQTSALLTSPNNILGAEYCRALLVRNSEAEIFPIERVGGGYKDTTVERNFSSATAIRAALGSGMQSISSNVPPYVFSALKRVADLSDYKKIAQYAILATAPERLKQLPDCSEGLENRLVSLARSCNDYETLVSEATSRRYPSSRIRRILATAVLGIGKKEVSLAKGSAPYLRLLAIKKERADELLAAFSDASVPLLVRAADRSSLPPPASSLLTIDERAADVRDLISGTHEKRRTRFL